ncbi:hypothetical protein ACHAXA_010085 [Cyclostephanos tholiformis]|uniref:Uncharacterized protein n=1 Tax=Cyclostephanos tholiformis TaxID=382380 RepID=A0ABD3R6S1_9STRA
MPASHLPDISKLKISELKEELDLYCVDTSGFTEKKDFTSALKKARETLPRPITTYREPEPIPESKKDRQKSTSSSSTKDPAAAAAAATASTTKSAPQSKASAPTPQAPSPTAQPTPASSSSRSSNPSSTTHKGKDKDARKALASRSPVIARQTLREHPSAKVLGERNGSYLPGSPFSFSLRGSLHEDDSAIIRVPDGVCLTISAASVDRKSMSTYLMQQGSIGVSLRISSEENPQLMPVWTFDKDRSSGYSASNLGIRVCGPRNVRLFAYMEMGMRSNATVEVFVFGSVCLDLDKF